MCASSPHSALARWEYSGVLRSHVSDVCDLTWSPTSQNLASASVDNTAAVFNIFSKDKVRLLHAHVVQT